MNTSLLLFFFLILKTQKSLSVCTNLKLRFYHHSQSHWRQYYRDTNDLQLTNMELRWTFPCSQSSFSDNSKDYNNFHILLSYSTWLTGFMRWNHWTRKLIQMIWLCIKCAINESSLLLQYLHFHTISDITRNFTRDQLIHFHSLEFSGKPSQYL